MNSTGMLLIVSSLVAAATAMPRGNTTEELCKSVNGEALYSRGACLALVADTYGPLAAAKCTRGDVIGVPGGRLADMDDVDVHAAFIDTLKKYHPSWVTAKYAAFWTLGNQLTATGHADKCRTYRSAGDKYEMFDCGQMLITVCQVKAAWVPAGTDGDDTEAYGAGNGTALAADLE